MTDFDDVRAFHQKFLPDVVQATPEFLEFRRRFLHEELQEFEQGMLDGDHFQMADALIDLVYVAMGTAVVAGYPWDELWADVQRANMQKQRAVADGSDSKRLSAFDVVKPHGWIPPHTDTIMRKHGFSRDPAVAPPGWVDPAVAEMRLADTRTCAHCGSRLRDVAASTIREINYYDSELDNAPIHFCNHEHFTEWQAVHDQA